MDKNNIEVGVIVGRFQVPMILTSDDNIFNYVLSQSFNTNIVVIGVPPSSIKATKNNPLDFDARRRMIEEAYGKKFQIMYLKDERSDFVWSSKLDEMIKTVAGNRDAVLFGTQEAMRAYRGEFKKEIYEVDKAVSNDLMLRDLAGKRVLSGEAWRAGAIWSSQNRYDSVCPTVDCLIFDGRGREVWMGKKKDENKLRFIGGFASPKDNSFEDTACREAKEETGLDCDILGYVCSMKINDWRYEHETDKIITTLYAMQRVGGTPKASDDIAEIQRVDLFKLNPEDVVEEHHELLEASKDWFKQATQDLIESES